MECYHNPQQKDRLNSFLALLFLWMIYTLFRVKKKKSVLVSWVYNTLLHISLVLNENEVLVGHMKSYSETIN